MIDSMTNRILIIDPSKTSAHSISMQLTEEFNLSTVMCNSLEEVVKLIEKDRLFNAAIIDPTLGDDPDAKVVDLILECEIPVIIYSYDIKPPLLDAIISKPIVDYEIKSTRNNCYTIINLLKHILRHQKTAILIIDDSQTARATISMMLANLNLHIIEARSVEEALLKLKEHPEIKLILTDYSMDGQTGLDLTREIRKKYSNKEVSIIGHSAYANPMMSADFIKNGANDFIRKPFKKGELMNRVLLQVDIIDYIQTIKEASEKDFLTSIYNRKYVYEVGRKLFENAKRGNITLACAMMDIDHFKNVNDTYGHDVGDEVIKTLAKELSDYFRKSDIVGRIGGEEFCVVLTNPGVVNLEDIFENLRKKIEEIVISGIDEDKNEFEFNFTISIGVTSVLSDSFEEMLKFADMKLYEAKNYGRNMVVL